MIAPKRDNGNGFRTSDCQIAEYNISSTILFFTLLYFVDCFAGNTRKCCFQCISRGYVLKTVFPLRLSCFSWDFGTMVCAVSCDPFINFFHLVFHFSGHSGFSGPFFCGYPRNDRKRIKKCFSVPKTLVFVNNRAGNAVLSAFPGKILQKRQ